MSPRRSGLIEDLADLSVRLPPTVSVLLAIGAYLAFHFLPARLFPIPAPAQGMPGPQVIPMFIATVSRYLQYIVPFALLLGALVGWYQRSRQRTP